MEEIEYYDYNGNKTTNIKRCYIFYLPLISYDMNGRMMKDIISKFKANHIPVKGLRVLDRLDKYGWFVFIDGSWKLLDSIYTHGLINAVEKHNKIDIL